MRAKRIFGWSERPSLNDAVCREVRFLEHEAAVMASRRDDVAARLRRDRDLVVAAKKQALVRAGMLVAVCALGVFATGMLWNVIEGQGLPNAAFTEVVSGGWRQLREARAAEFFGDGWLVATITGFVVTALWSLRDASPERRSRMSPEEEGSHEQIETAVQLCLVACVPTAIFLAVPSAEEVNVAAVGVFPLLAWLSALIAWHIGTPEGGHRDRAVLAEAELRYAYARLKVLRRRLPARGWQPASPSASRWTRMAVELGAWPAGVGVVGLFFTRYPAFYLLFSAVITAIVVMTMATVVLISTPDSRGRPAPWVAWSLSLFMITCGALWVALAWVLWGVAPEPMLITLGFSLCLVYTLGRRQDWVDSIELAGLEWVVRRHGTVATGR